MVGLGLILVYGRNGWFDAGSQRNGVQVLFALPAMVLATLFVTLPSSCARSCRRSGRSAPSRSRRRTLGAAAGRRSGASRCRRSARPQLRRRDHDWRARRRVRRGRIVSGQHRGPDADRDLRRPGRVRIRRVAAPMRMSLVLAAIAVVGLRRHDLSPTEGARLMSIQVRNIIEALRRFRRARRRLLRDHRRLAVALLGPSGSASPRCCASSPGSSAGRRRGRGLGRARDRPAAAAAQRRLRVPALRRVPAPDGRDNVAFGLEVRKRPKAEIRGRVDELLEARAPQGLGERYPRSSPAASASA